jgi:hypothetical protein
MIIQETSETPKEATALLGISRPPGASNDRAERPVGRSASELCEAAVDGDFAGGHEAAVSDARKAAAAPISDGSAMRWSGVIAA